VIGALLFKHFRFLTNSPSGEILITFLLAYSSYLISDIFNLSGVISLLMSGIVLQNYSWYSLSKKGKHATMFRVFLSLNNFYRESFEALSKAAEAFLFCYLGITVYFYSKDPWSLSLVICTLIILAISRLGGCVLLF